MGEKSLIRVLGVVLKISKVSAVVVIVDPITEANQIVLAPESLIVVRQQSLVQRALLEKIGWAGIRVGGLRNEVFKLFGR